MENSLEDDSALLLRTAAHLMEDYYVFGNHQNTATAAKRIGYQLGLGIPKDIRDKTPRRKSISLDSVIGELLAPLWKTSELGILGWRDRRASLLRVQCPGVNGKTSESRKEETCSTCALKEGLLEGVLHSSLKKNFRVSAVSPWNRAKANSFCVFQINETTASDERFEEEEVQKVTTKVILDEDVALRLPRLWSLLKA